MSRKQESSARFAAVELSDKHLRLAVCKRDKNGLQLVDIESIQWRDQSKSPLTEAGRAELTIAVRSWLQKFRLNNAEILVTLSGEYCVSRGVTGSTDRVRHELSELERRTKLYLSLGHGEKALGVHVRQVDARHQHALVAVVNQRMVDTLLQVFSSCGLEVKIIEPTLVSLCRLVGTLELDADHPVLVAHLTEQGVEIAISHQGYVLLDYRPPKSEEENESFSTLISDQLHRLQRFCFRYCRFAEGNLEKLYICGDDQLVAQALADTKEISGLQTESLNYLTQQRWQAAAEKDSGGIYAACLGLLSQLDNTIPYAIGPNLLDRAATLNRAPLKKELLRMFLPIAATLLVAIGVWGWAIYTQILASGVGAQIAELEPDIAAMNSVKLEIKRSVQRKKTIEALNAGIAHFPWNDLPSQIAHCMPEDVWLDSISSDSEGKLQLKGGSFREDSVFEFVRVLGESPEFDRVALNRSNQVYTKLGTAVDFMVLCNLAKSTD